MKKHIIDESNGLSYTLKGELYYPDLILPPQDDRPIGNWGRRHKEYLEKNHKVQFQIMLMKGTFHDYLADINEQAEEMFFRLVKDMAKADGITEQLKAENQLEWVRRMNSIRNRAREIVNAELIYG